MYSLRLVSMLSQLAKIANGMTKVVRMTNSIDTPSTPILYLKAPSQARSSTNWKPGLAVSKLIQISSETANVISVVHSATQRMLRVASEFRHAMNSAPANGRNVMIDRMGVEGERVIISPPRLNT